MLPVPIKKLMHSAGQGGSTTAAQVLRSGTSAQPWFAEEWLGIKPKWIYARNNDP